MSVLPISSATPLQVAGYNVLRNYGPSGRDIAARDNILISTIDNVTDIVVCVTNYCAPNPDCRAASFDRSDLLRKTCKLYSNELTLQDLVLDNNRDVAYGGPRKANVTVTATLSAVSSTSTSTSTSGSSSSSSTSSELDLSSSSVDSLLPTSSTELPGDSSTESPTSSPTASPTAVASVVSACLSLKHLDRVY